MLYCFFSQILNVPYHPNSLQLAREVPLVDVDVAPGGSLCCIASADGHCCLWDLETGQIKHVIEGHEAM